MKSRLVFKSCFTIDSNVLTLLLMQSLLLDNPRSPLRVNENGSLGGQVESSSNGIIVSASASGESVTIALHPLVIMNVAEHYTRTRAQESTPVDDQAAGSSKHGTTSHVVGALIGMQKGRNLEVMNSFELKVERSTDLKSEFVIDHTFYHQKEEQFKQVFPDMDFLGWYTTGDAPTASDIDFHTQVCAFNESPIFMKLNPVTRNSKLPIAMYESVIDLVNGQTKLLFSPVNFSLATEEAERIGLDHMAKMSNWNGSSGSADSSNSVAGDHLKVQYNAVKMLRDRVRIIRDYVVDTKEERIPWNHEIIREAHNLSNRLPLIQSNSFRQEFFNQCNDVALMTYLGMLTKGTHSMNQFVTKFGTLYDRQGMGRRMRGPFY